MNQLSMRVAAEPVSVPAARRFVTDGLRTWGALEVLEDARLCVSELAANSALHADSDFMQVSVERLTDAVRVVVADESLVPLDDLRAQAELNGGGEVVPGVDGTTGRGLFLVAALAKAWGVVRTDEGTAIWADVSSASSVSLPRPGVAEPAEEGARAMPAGWRLVRLRDCPVDLSLQQDQHLDEVVRELQLIQAADASAPVVEVMASLLATQAHARHTGRRAALRARAEGHTHVDVAMPALASVADDVLALHSAAQEADRLCRERELLTLAADPEVSLLRTWMTETIVAQVRDGAEAVAWEEWRAAH